MRERENDMTSSEENITNDLPNKERNYKTLMSLTQYKKDYLISKYCSPSQKSNMKYTCKFPECKGREYSNKKSNIMTHFARKHFGQIDYDDVTIKNDMKSAIENFGKVRDDKQLNTTLVSSKNQFVNDLLDMMLSGVTLNQFESKGFQSIISPYATLHNVRVNRHNVRDIINCEYLVMKKKIQSACKDKPISIKLDGTTLHGIYYIGINAQVVVNYRIESFNLGIVKHDLSSSSLNLANKLKEVLGEFQIQTDQVLSVTTDNAANYLKIGKILNDEVVKHISDNIDNLKVQFYNNLVDDEWSHFSEDDINILSKSIGDIFIISCGVHTLQLAICDSLNTLPATISLARFVIKKLRTNKMMLLLEKYGYKKPLLDVPTRWNSTYDMIKSFLQLKNFVINQCESYADLKLTNVQWGELESFIKCYKPVATFTIESHDKGMLLSEFIIRWLAHESDTNEVEVESTMKDTLIQNLVHRRNVLLKNHVLLCAIYLDPRYKDVVSQNDSYYNIVTGILLKTFSKYNFNKCVDPSDIPDDDIKTHTRSNYINSVFNSTNTTATENSDCTSVFSDSLFKELTIYNTVPKKAPRDSPFDYWKGAKETCPILHDLALAILAIPASQVSVESSFSILKWYLSDRRTSLDKIVLKKLVFLKINRDFNKRLLSFDEIFEEGEE